MFDPFLPLSRSAALLDSDYDAAYSQEYFRLMFNKLGLLAYQQGRSCIIIQLGSQSVGCWIDYYDCPLYILSSLHYLLIYNILWCGVLALVRGSRASCRIVRDDGGNQLRLHRYNRWFSANWTVGSILYCMPLLSVWYLCIVITLFCLHCYGCSFYILFYFAEL